MFPILFSIGSFEFRTITVFVLLSLFFSSFIFWRKGREEHYSQADIFDGFVLATLVGIVVARGIFILFSISYIGFNLIRWFDIANFPGFNSIAGLAAAALFLYRYSVKNKWDAFEVLDFWVTSVALGLSISSIGSFFNGTGYGFATSMPWGVVFPQLIEPHHPVQIYFAIFYAALFVYLSKVEYSYRTFTWYRFGKKTAQTGFLTSAFLILVSLFTFIFSFFKPATLEFVGINFDMVLSLLVALIGVVLLYVRSGRSVPILTRKKVRPMRTKIEKLHE